MSEEENCAEDPLQRFVDRVEFLIRQENDLSAAEVVGALQLIATGISMNVLTSTEERYMEETDMKTPSFRALCAELVKLVERCPVTSDTDWIYDRNELIIQFHNARLATLPQPAPEPGDEKGLAQEHLARLMRDAIGVETDHNSYINAAGRILDRPEFLLVARAALSQPAPKPPTDEEIIYSAIKVGLAFCPDDKFEEVYLPFPDEDPLNDLLIAFARVMLARWGQGNG